MSASGSSAEGLVLSPFRALRYDPGRVPDLGAVLSPPYDVIDEAEIAELERRDPHNVVRLILPRDPDGEGSRYPAAAQTLAAWRAEQVLRPDPEPALYVYEEAADGHVQRGLVGAVGLRDPDAGVILPHENTMAGPVADRLALTSATEANLEPIFLVYDGGGAAREAVAQAGSGEPLVQATTPDGVTHRLWAVRERATLDAIADDLGPRRAVIADGHHRYATYLRYQADRHAAGAGPGPWDFGLAFLVDAATFGPQVHASHRVIPTLQLERAAQLAADGFTVRRLELAASEALPALTDAGRRGPAFLLAGGPTGATYLLTEPRADLLEVALPQERSAAWRGLDVTVAHRVLIHALWGLTDDERVVDFRHDVDSALAAAIDSGGTALLLNPTPVEAVSAVAAAGDRMPRKSTLFTPKPATGLLIRALSDQ